MIARLMGRGRRQEARTVCPGGRDPARIATGDQLHPQPPHLDFTESGGSVERAVDDDFSQSGPENRELVILEALDEQLRQAANVDRCGFGHACDTGVGQGDNHMAPILSGVRSTYQPVINQTRDAAGQPRARDERGQRHL
jgi:hypothetical protein